MFSLLVTDCAMTFFWLVWGWGGVEWPFHIMWCEKRKENWQGSSTELWGHPNGYYLEAQLTHAQGRMRVERENIINFPGW